MPDAQIITMRDATAAVLQQLGYGPERVIGRKEYATHYLNIKWARQSRYGLVPQRGGQGPVRTISDINRSSTAMLRSRQT
ncbi:gp30 domain protein [Mycobacteroides abscessus subsp. bolletii 1513]|uniref:Gp30 domain protein n=1 Tax=Mycobacteroides abscessus subsp. bolletii 1513 TaxID=1299321 RepID=X8DYG8_9MYCO|nr:gp30 domain protein [Mycobacteroides abscessus subsp. bolletii 1513]